MIKKIRLGDLLVEHKVITQEELERALREQNATGKKLGDVLVDLHYIDEMGLLLFLSKQLNLAYLDLNFYEIKPEVIREIPERVARRLCAIPIDRIKNGFLVAMSDPTDLSAFDELSRRLKKFIQPVLVKKSELMRIIDEVFRRTEEIASLVGALEHEMGAYSIKNDLAEEIGDAPIKKLLYSIFEDAIQVNASDIHIEPITDGMRIRQRIDGVLQEQVMKGSTIISALVLRIKLMAKLNISERRLPQDGRFSIWIKEKKIDIRIATMPLQNGEAVVMRLLDQSQNVLQLQELGLSDLLLKSFKNHLARPHGMILVTGPTGSGKSTLLYAGLSELNIYEKKIITVEDPVEYTFDRINQIQVQAKIGLTFSSILRSVLRNDPDVIMVGEIRDEETAHIALRAAMTGHLVLSTLHTNDALSGPWRLLDMGVEPFLAASALRLVVAQRLVKRVCPSCIETYIPDKNEITFLKNIQITVPLHIKFVKGRGCSQCQMRGFKGRIGVYEMIEMTHDMVEALSAHDISSFETQVKKNPLYRPLIFCALEYAYQKIISLDEVLRLSVELLDT